MITKVSIISLFTVVLALLVSLAWLRRTDGVYEIGQVIPAPTGYSVDATFIAAKPTKCTIIRITSDNCKYCKQDRLLFDRLVAKAKGAQCSIAVIGPRVGDITMASGGPVRPLQYVDFTFGQTLMPFLTPQTLVTDSSQRLVWQRQGALDDVAVAAASRVLDTLR